MRKRDGAGSPVGAKRRRWVAMLVSWRRPSTNDGRGPGGRRGLMVMRSGGREVLAEAERLQDSVEVELRQPAGEVADAELIRGWVREKIGAR